MRGKIDKAIVDIIERVLRRDFDNIKIVSIKMSGDDDRDDGDFLRIQVVFDGEMKDVSAHKVAGAVRHVRPSLMDAGEDAFPLFSFVSKRDLKGRQLEAV